MNHATRNTLVVQRRNFGKGLMLTNLISEHMHANMMKSPENSLDKEIPVPQESFFSHCFEKGYNGNFWVEIKVIDGADIVCRK